MVGAEGGLVVTAPQARAGHPLPQWNHCEPRHGRRWERGSPQLWGENTSDRRLEVFSSISGASRDDVGNTADAAGVSVGAFVVQCA